MGYPLESYSNFEKMTFKWHLKAMQQKMKISILVPDRLLYLWQLYFMTLCRKTYFYYIRFSKGHWVFQNCSTSAYILASCDCPVTAILNLSTGVDTQTLTLSTAKRNSRIYPKLRPQCYFKKGVKLGRRTPVYKN